MALDPHFDSFIQKAGAELETAYRAHGTPLPQGVTGEDLVRAALEDMEREIKSPEGVARSERLMKIVREVEASLPGGIEHPEFADRVQERLKDLPGWIGNDPGASA